MTALLELPTLTVHGTPSQLGEQHGEALRAAIAAFVPMRFEATLAHLRAYGLHGTDAIVDVARRCLAVHAAWDPDGHAEHLGIARGAGVDAVQLYAAANMTDLRDVLAYGGPADGEGCSAVLVPHGWSADGAVMAAQTWDLNPQDVDFVVAIERRPARGPATWSVTCAGCLTLVGFSDVGLAVGTTNIKTAGARAGVGYMGVLHKMLAAPTFDAAAASCATAPRAAAHTYWLADATRLAEWETTPGSVVRRDATQRPLTRTNHCLAAGHADAEAPTASSRARLARLDQFVATEKSLTPATLRALFADRRDGADSISRYAEDGQGTATNAVVICVPARREAWACRGPADRGRWRRLAFDSAAG
ncbi:MAG: hypothetical protein EXR79_09515 [Myxococcales bacterium]|nr:hypothetical protein [Myxococcales bacterium]